MKCCKSEGTLSHLRKLGISTCNLNKRQLASRITKHLEKIFSIPASSIDAPIYSFRDLKKQTSKKCRGPATSRTRTSTRSVMMKRAHSVARPAAMQSPVSLRITRSSRCNERKEDGGTSESRPGTEKVTERRCGQAGRPGEDEENGYDNFQKMIRPLLSERLKVQRQAPLEVPNNHVALIILFLFFCCTVGCKSDFTWHIGTME